MAADPELKPAADRMRDVSPRARHLFQQSLVWDMLLPWEPGENSPEIDTLLPRFRAAGVNFVSLTIASGHEMGVEATVRHLARVRREIENRADWLRLTLSVADVRQAQQEGKLAVAFNFQDTWPFQSCLDLVKLYYDLGVRSALLTYNLRNLVADGCVEPADAGLSRLGIQVVREMSRVGMLVDGSHSGFRSTMEAMEHCGGPFIFSHSNPHAIAPHYRNIRDEQIKACAATGGVVGINGVGAFLDDIDAPTEAIFRCLDYVVQLVGAEHAGLGFDFISDIDRITQWVRDRPIMWPMPEGQAFSKPNFAGPEQMAELTQMMQDAGYGEAAIRGILGENWARVCAAVWK